MSKNNQITLSALALLCICTGAAGTFYGFFQLLSGWGVPFALIIILTPLILSRQLPSMSKMSHRIGIGTICVICIAVGVVGNYMTLQKAFLGNQEETHLAKAEVASAQNKLGFLSDQRSELVSTIKDWNSKIETELQDGGEGPTAKGLIKQRDHAQTTLLELDEKLLTAQQDLTAATTAVLSVKRESSSLQAWLDLHIDAKHHQGVLTGFFFFLALLLEPIGLIAMHTVKNELKETELKPAHESDLPEVPEALPAVPDEKPEPKTEVLTAPTPPLEDEAATATKHKKPATKMATKRKPKVNLNLNAIDLKSGAIELFAKPRKAKQS